MTAAKLARSTSAERGSGEGSDAEREPAGPDYSVVTGRFEKLLRDPKLPTRVHSFFYAVKFARFNALVRKDRRLAEKILLDAMLRDKVHYHKHPKALYPRATRQFDVVARDVRRRVFRRCSDDVQTTVFHLN